MSSIVDFVEMAEKKTACEFAEWYLQNEKYYYGSIESIYNAWKKLKDKSLSVKNKNVKITTEGLMSGDKWQIKITGIKDRYLYDTEVAILKMFGRKKKCL